MRKAARIQRKKQRIIDHHNKQPNMWHCYRCKIEKPHPFICKCGKNAILKYKKVYANISNCSSVLLGEDGDV